MKKEILVLIGMVTGLATFAQQVQDERMQVAQSGTAAEKQVLTQELLEQARAFKAEADYEDARRLLFIMGHEKTADSLNQVMIKRFPKGATARGTYITNVLNKEEDLKKKEKLYKQLLKKWPVEKFPGDEIAYDYVAADLARNYAKEGNFEKAVDYLRQLRERFWRAQGYDPVAGILLSKGDTATAIPLIQTAVEDAEYYINIPEEKKDNKARFAAVGYPGYVSRLVGVYQARGKQEEALALIEKAIALVPDQAARFSNTYYKGLKLAGRNLEALQQLEILYKQGEFSYQDEMQGLYVQLNGTEKGFDSYIARLQADAIAKIREHIKSFEKNEPAPAFELLDMEGKKVSLASLKGKVVVLDFWATWCQPCKNSFPGMKAAQESYAGDEDVKFLFINTWERTENYKEEVKDFIAENKYPFHVLFDDVKDPQTNQVLAGKFGVNGIPAKFIIDKEGNIRYALTGSSPVVDYIKLEMRELIEAAKKPYKG